MSKCRVIPATVILQVFIADPSALLLHMRQKSWKSWLLAQVIMYKHWFKIKMMHKL